MTAMNLADRCANAVASDGTAAMAPPRTRSCSIAIGPGAASMPSMSDASVDRSRTSRKVERETSTAGWPPSSVRL